MAGDYGLGLTCWATEHASNDAATLLHVNEHAAAQLTGIPATRLHDQLPEWTPATEADDPDTAWLDQHFLLVVARDQWDDMHPELWQQLLALAVYVGELRTTNDTHTVQVHKTLAGGAL
jgi:hypothetical protein